MIKVETKQHTLSDGRTLAYCQYGDTQGIPVFFAHGGPGSRLEGELFHESALKHGFRLITTDRPGMGRSTFKPNRQLLDYPKDILELAEAMGIDKFGVMGWSGGGAHTVVCGRASRRLGYSPERHIRQITPVSRHRRYLSAGRFWPASGRKRP